MKQSLLLIFIILITFSCSKENVNTTPSTNNNEVSFYTSSSLSKITDTLWEQDDRVGIYMINNQTRDILSNNIEYTIGDNYTDSVVFSVVDLNNTIYYPSNTLVDFMAYYPYQANIENMSYQIDVSDQSDLTDIDFVVADKLTSKGGDEKRTPIGFTFRHKLSKLQLNIEANDEVSDLTGIEVSFLDVATKASYTFGVETTSSATEDVIIASEAPNDLDLEVTDGSDVTNCTVTAILVPQDLTTKILRFTVDGNYYYSPELSTIFESGCSYTYNVSIGDNRVLLKSTNIEEWTTGGENDVTMSMVEGTRGNPIILSSSDDLFTLASEVNAGDSKDGIYYRLESSSLTISSWTPIGSKDYPFKGGFDGNNVSLKIRSLANSASDYLGVFGYIEDAEISNVAVSGSVVSAENNYIGGVAGYASNSQVTDCSNSASVSGGNYIGGIVGYASNTQFTNCHNQAMLGGSGYLGGIAGVSTAGTIINNCSNLAAITTNSQYIGGIVGLAETNSFIINCYNKGEIMGTLIGGIAGESVSSFIINCYNNMAVAGYDIQATNTNAGIAGNTSGSNTFISCYNTGVIYNGTNMGGICADYDTAESNTLIACFSKESISGISSKDGDIFSSESDLTISLNQAAEDYNASSLWVNYPRAYKWEIEDNNFYPTLITTSVAGE